MKKEILNNKQEVVVPTEQLQNSMQPERVLDARTSRWVNAVTGQPVAGPNEDINQTVSSC